MRLIKVLVALIVLSSCNSGLAPSVQTVEGSYSLISWIGTRPDGSIVYPYGEDAKGFLYYDAHGMMSMQLVKVNRPRLGSDDYDSLDAELVREAYKGFFSYYGSYAVDEKSSLITHVIEGCKQPDWRGRTLMRRYTVTAEELVIRTDSIIGMDHVLTWQRLY